MDHLQRIVEGLLSNPISQTFCLIIAAYFAFAIIFTMVDAGNPRIRPLVENAPSTLTSLGILGTFTGIFVGLLDFDIRTINRSVPLLLEGLKVAFGTSIFGLASAVAFKILRPILEKTSVLEDAPARNLLESLQTMTTAVKRLERTNKKGLEKLRDALIDGGDGSVSGQLQRLRANFTDLGKTTDRGFKAQIKEFREFSEHISKAFSEAIIEELKSVIREFNEKISEQFGENFKKLNEAVGRLVEWQENYRQQLSDLKEAFDLSLASVQAAQTAVSNIENSTSAISEHMERLSEINTSLHRQLTELHEGLSSLAEMRSEAKDAIPMISKKIASMTHTISEAVDLQKDSIRKVTETVESATNELDEIVKSVGNEINASLSEHRESHGQMLDGLQSAFNETLQNATNQMNDAIGQLDKAMQGEIERVVRTMAENLSGITQKFVEDYAPLLQQSRKVVELSREAAKQ